MFVGPRAAGRCRGLTTAAEAVARRQEAEQGWWRYGLGLMLVGLVVESLVGRRT